MTDTTTILSKAAILDALQEVMDPEIPTLSVIDLGLISSVTVEGEQVQVKLLPTFTACPAIRMMQQTIAEKIRSLGADSVSVLLDTSQAWNSDRITPEGKRKLERFGLGTPERHGGDFSLHDIEHSACPHCGSTDTTLNSLFGSTLCRSIHFCFSCKQAFERFKPV